MSTRSILNTTAALAVFAGSVFSAGAIAQTTPLTPPKIDFVDVARQAGLTAKTIYGGERTKKHILESTGSGVAFIDYDNDGWPDVFLVNGSTLEGFPIGQQPTSHLYRNNHDGTFSDVTQTSGTALAGWGQGVCAGDYDNDGWTDLFVTYWGHSALLRNDGHGAFQDITKKAGLWHADERWDTGCAFVDYDRDGNVDLFVARYVDFDAAELKDSSKASACTWMGVRVFCGPMGLKGARNELYHNNGDGTFTDVSKKAGIHRAGAHSCFTALTGDFDNDGWPDVYVSCDSTESLLFRNNHDGTFTESALASGVAYNGEGHTQAGMGADAANYDGSENLSIVKTNFSGDIPTLYRNEGGSNFTDVAYEAGLGGNSRLLGWGTLFVDVDNDGWPDLFMANGHVYPEIDGKGLNTTFRQRKLLYWNSHNAKFKDVSLEGGPALTAVNNSRGLAAADIDNDGTLELLVNNNYDAPSLLRNRGEHGNWLLVKLVGTKSNRSAIGARVVVRADGHQQLQEVRSGGSYISQSDFRLHFGLADARKVDAIEIQWPSGLVSSFADIAPNQVITIVEGKGIAASPKP